MDEDYNTDTISLTSTVESDNEGIYDIKGILSEAMGYDQHGEPYKKYLVEWESYPLHQCTWEPEFGLAETGLLPEWAQKKVDMGKEAFNQFIKKNEDRFYEALERYQKNKQVRRRKRAKKRSKLNGRNQAIIIDTSEEDTPSTHRKQTKQQKHRQQTAKIDSEDDKPLIPLHHQKRKKQQETGSLAQPDSGLFVENYLVPRRGPLLQSSDDEAGSSSDKNKNNLRQKTITQTRTNKELNLSKSVVDPDKTKSKPALPLRKPVADRAPSGAQAQIRSPESSRKPTASDRPTGAKTTDLRQEHGRSSGAAAQSSAITSRIKMTNEPKTHRSQWNTEGQYKKLSTRRNAEKRSRIEGTPDLNALEFVGSHLPNFGRRKSTVPTDNPYARREAGTRGIQESDMDRTSQRQPNDQAEPLHDWEAEKVPLVCPDWRLSNNCPFPAKDCRFLHRNTDANGHNLEIGHISGKVPPKYLKRPLTCFFWMQDPSGCNKSADECLYAHKNTGWMPQSAANPEPIAIDLTALPVSENFASRSRGGRHTPPIKGMKSVEKTCWFWANGGCNKPDGDCRFKHYDTGIMSSLPMCSFFLKGACRSSAEECKYSHVAPGQPDVNNDTIFTTLVTQELMQQPPTERTQDYQRDTQRVVQSSVVDHSATNEEQQRVSTSTVLQPAVDSAMTSVLRPATTSSSSLKQSIEQTLRITFNDLFEWGDDGVKRMMLDRKAYLLFHPEEHLEQLDVITRWLLMHHVEVSSHWFQGGWEYYKQQIANGGSGIVIVHPDFEYFSCVPDFGQLLQRRVRIWSLGNHLCIQHNQAAMNSPAVAQHDCIEIFPIGGLIYITDDVFEEKPHLALEIVKLFLAKINMLRKLAGSDSPWEDINDVELYWRLCVRPELMAYLFQRCEEQEEALEAGELKAVARATLYTLLSDPRLIEQDSPIQPLHDKVDNFPILSERRMFAEGEPIDYFKALSHSRQEANLRMIRYYSGLHVDMRQDYRYFYVVHTDPLEPCAQQWKEEIQTLSDVITPERYVAELSKDGQSQSSGQLSEFYERYILKVNDATAIEPRPKKKTANVQQVTETQVSLEDGEV